MQHEVIFMFYHWLRQQQQHSKIHSASARRAYGESGLHQTKARRPWPPLLPCFSRGDSSRSQASRTVVGFSLLLLSLPRTLVPRVHASAFTRGPGRACAPDPPRRICCPLRACDAAWPALRGRGSHSRGAEGLQMADRPRVAVAVRDSCVTRSLSRQKVCLGSTASATVSPSSPRSPRQAFPISESSGRPAGSRGLSRSLLSSLPCLCGSRGCQDPD